MADPTERTHFHTLSSYTDRHLSAEIDLATAYRTLELFSTLKVVQKLDFDAIHSETITYWHLIFFRKGSLSEPLRKIHIGKKE
jgi:Fe2+ or Zn2+ uptake regulation protein